MVRENWDALPHFPVPPGFSCSYYAPGDEGTWTQIQAAADQLNEITPDLFTQQFGSNPAELADRQLFLLNADGNAIATATAWHNPGFRDGSYGRVHWVAVLPDYQNRGFGKALMSLVCSRLRELGYAHVYLTTSSARPAALRLYETFGFQVAVLG
jgi:ribosomal protein S18 acetylase RimI-like enzyme